MHFCYLRGYVLNLKCKMLNLKLKSKLSFGVHFKDKMSNQKIHLKVLKFTID
jgi:hypothetical protein